jgi:hypothetical protein
VIVLILLACVFVGLLVYFGIVRPFMIPLQWKIPTGAAYRASLGAPKH